MPTNHDEWIAWLETWPEELECWGQRLQLVSNHDRYGGFMGWSVWPGELWVKYKDTKIESPSVDPEFPKLCANFVLNNQYAKQIPPRVAGAILRLQYDGKISKADTKEFFKEYIEADERPMGPAMIKVLSAVLGVEAPKQDDGFLPIVKEVIATVPFKGNEENKINFFMGQVMKRKKGDPAAIRKLIEENL